EPPDSIGNLSSLEMLFADGCTFIRKLPSSFEKLGSLREVDLGGSEQSEKLPYFGKDYCLKKIILGGCIRLGPDCRGLHSSPSSLYRDYYLRGDW
ncbi:hypothetical protein KI387_029090, partial [Taxus chinensis]